MKTSNFDKIFPGEMNIEYMDKMKESLSQYFLYINSELVSNSKEISKLSYLEELDCKSIVVTVEKIADLCGDLREIISSLEPIDVQKAKRRNCIINEIVEHPIL